MPLFAPYLLSLSLALSSATNTPRVVKPLFSSASLSIGNSVKPSCMTSTPRPKASPPVPSLTIRFVAAARKSSTVAMAGGPPGGSRVRGIRNFVADGSSSSRPRSSNPLLGALPKFASACSSDIRSTACAEGRGRQRRRQLSYHNCVHCFIYRPGQNPSRTRPEGDASGKN